MNILASLSRGVAFFFVGFCLTAASGCAATTHWPDRSDPLAGMGVNIHFTDAKPGELEMLSRAGFRWVRMDFSWSQTERATGVYDFSAYERLLDQLDQFHIRALLILDYTNPLYDANKPSHTDRGRAAFARWAVAAVKHFQDRGVLWEIWNEPNGAWFWKPRANAGDYARLALTVSRAIQVAAPDAQVAGPALNGTDLDFLKVSAKAGVLPYWCGITIHPYLRGGPENYAAVYRQVRQMIRKYTNSSHQIDVMCGESGYSTTWAGTDDATQGRYLARLFLFDVSSGVPLTIWYDWRDDGTDLKNQEHNFGIVHHEYHMGAANVYDPKPAYLAAATFSRQLAGCRFEKRLRTASSLDYVLIFGTPDSECLVAWTAASSPHAIDFPAPDGIYQVTGYDGTRKPAARSIVGTIHLTLDGGPQYLKLR